MAAIDHSAYARSAATTGFGATISRSVFELTRSIRTYVAYRQTLQSLRGLSGRQLADIGLDGVDIEAVARNMAARNFG